MRQEYSKTLEEKIWECFWILWWLQVECKNKVRFVIKPSSQDLIFFLKNFIVYNKNTFLTHKEPLEDMSRTLIAALRLWSVGALLNQVSGMVIVLKLKWTKAWIQQPPVFGVKFQILFKKINQDFIVKNHDSHVAFSNKLQVQAVNFCISFIDIKGESWRGLEKCYVPDTDLHENSINVKLNFPFSLIGWILKILNFFWMRWC